MIKVVIADFDNTLYDWTGWFVQAFYLMAEKVARIIKKPFADVLIEYQEFNRKHTNVEPAYSTLALPCVIERYPDKTWTELKAIFEPAFKLFRGTRQEKLKLYPGVANTLKKIKARGITLVGCSDSTLESCQKRLTMLKIDKYFTRMYVRENSFICPIRSVPELPTVVREVSNTMRKPSPKLLLKICSEMGVSTEEVLYVGDSLSRDIGMANLAGIKSVWAKYGSDLAHELQQKLDVISFHSPADFKRLQRILGGNTPCPDYVVKGFGGVITAITKENELKKN